MEVGRSIYVCHKLAETSPYLEQTHDGRSITALQSVINFHLGFLFPWSYLVRTIKRCRGRLIEVAAWKKVNFPFFSTIISELLLLLLLLLFLPKTRGTFRFNSYSKNELKKQTNNLSNFASQKFYFFKNMPILREMFVSHSWEEFSLLLSFINRWDRRFLKNKASFTT